MRQHFRSWLVLSALLAAPGAQASSSTVDAVQPATSAPARRGQQNRSSTIWPAQRRFDYPGDAYVDFVSPTYYGDSLTVPNYASYVALGKPMGFADGTTAHLALGSNQHATELLGDPAVVTAPLRG